MECRVCGAPVAPVSTVCNRCGAPAPELDAATAAMAAAPGRRGGIGRTPVVVLLVLVLVGGIAAAGAYGYQNVLLTTFRSAAFLPRDTWLMATTTLRPGFLQSLNSAAIVDAFVKRPGSDEALKSLQKSADTAGVDARTEVVPLLTGEVAVAVSGTVQAPSGVGLLETSEPEKLLRVLAKSAKASEPADRYRDGPSFEAGTARSPTYYIASPRGWVILSTARADAERAYDRIESGGDSLAADPRYRGVMERLPTDKLGYLYVDMRAVFGDPTVRKQIDALPAEARDRLDPLSSRIAMSIEAQSDGIAAHWESIPDRALSPKTGLSSGNALMAVDRLPSDTLFAVGGHDLPTLLTGIDAAMSSYLATARGPLAPKVEFTFAKWFSGEFALGIGRGDMRLDRGAAQGVPDVLFAAHLADVGEATKGIDALDQFTAAKTTTVQGYTLKQVGTGQAAFLYAVADDWFYALTGARTDKLIAATARTDGLTKAANYALVKRVIRGDGLTFYADLEATRTFFEDLTPAAQRRQYDEQVRVFLQPLRAVGGSIRSDPNGDVHGEVILAVKR